MPWYGREFYSDENVLVLSLEQEGSYFRLLWNCWQEGSLPADTAKLAAICKNTPVRRFEGEIWPALRNLFVVHDDGRLIHPKVEALRTAKEQLRAKWCEGARLANGKRWGRDRVEIRGRSDGDLTEIPAEYRIPNTDYQELKPCASDDARVPDSLPPIDDPPFGTIEPAALFPSQGRTRPARADGLTLEQETWFGVWWPAYWLHKAKKVARRAFAKHVKTAARFEQVMAATRSQAPEMLTREPQHRPHGATWLNGERWADEAAAPVQCSDEAKRDFMSNSIDRALAIIDQKGKGERK